MSDPTGERRSWHVAVTKYDREAFLADKDQLYAEAVVREPAEKLWLDTPELEAAHDGIVATAKEPNELVDQLTDLCGEAWHVNGKDEERISTADIRAKLLMKPEDSFRCHNLGRRILDAMTTLGWTKAPGRLRCHKSDQATKGYTRPLPFGPRNVPSHGQLTLGEPPVVTAEDVGEPGEGDVALEEAVKARAVEVGPGAGSTAGPDAPG